MTTNTNHASTLAAIRDLIADDAYAMSFQSMVQYRSALIAELRALFVPEPMSEALAAADGTLHGAIDYWQGRALKAEAAPVAVGEAAGIVKHLPRMDVLWLKHPSTLPDNTHLYAHPPTAQVAERQPLTEERLKTIDYEAWRSLPSDATKWERRMAFARAIERAHGIPASGEAK